MKKGEKDREKERSVNESSREIEREIDRGEREGGEIERVAAIGRRDLKRKKTANTGQAK